MRREIALSPLLSANLPLWSKQLMNGALYQATSGNSVTAKDTTYALKPVSIIRQKSVNMHILLNCPVAWPGLVLLLCCCAYLFIFGRSYVPCLCLLVFACLFLLCHRVIGSAFTVLNEPYIMIWNKELCVSVCLFASFVMHVLTGASVNRFNFFICRLEG